MASIKYILILTNTLMLCACSDLTPADSFVFLPEHTVAERDGADASANADQRKALSEKREASQEIEPEQQDPRLHIVVVSDRDTNADEVIEQLLLDGISQDSIRVALYESEATNISLSLADSITNILESYDDDLQFEVIATENVIDQTLEVIDELQITNRFIASTAI